jgi:lysophospholipase L1-like esterase
MKMKIPVLAAAAGRKANNPSRQLINFDQLSDGAVPAFSGFTVASGVTNNTATGTILDVNSGFDTDATGWTPTGCTLASVAGGVAGNALEITRVSGTTQVAINTFTTVAGEPVMVRYSVKAGTSGNEASRILLRNAPAGTVLLDEGITASGVWQTYSRGPVAVGTTSTYLRAMKNSATAGTMLFDNIIALRPNWAACFSLRKFSSQYGAVKGCWNRTVTYNDGMGVVMCADSDTNPQNFVLAYKLVASATIYFIKCVNGVFTALTGGVVTNQEDSPIEIRRFSGNTFVPYYNGTAVGAGNEITDASIIGNTYHGLADFSNVAGANTCSRFLFTATSAPKRIAIIGDSICVDTAGSTNRWATYFGQFYGSGDNTLLNHAVGGAKILPNAGNDMETQTAAAASDNADIIIIALGVNDGNLDAGIQAEYQANVQALKLSNPTATIYAILPWPIWAGVGGAETDKGNVRTAVIAACAAEGVTYYNPYADAVYTSTNTGDGIHPNNSGVRKAVTWVLGKFGQ